MNAMDSLCITHKYGKNSRPAHSVGCLAIEQKRGARVDRSPVGTTMMRIGQKCVTTTVHRRAGQGWRDGTDAGERVRPWGGGEDAAARGREQRASKQEWLDGDDPDPPHLVRSRWQRLCHSHPRCSPGSILLRRSLTTEHNSSIWAFLLFLLQQLLGDAIRWDPVIALAGTR